MSYISPVKEWNVWLSHKNVKSHKAVTFCFREIDTLVEVYKMYYCIRDLMARLA